MLVKMGEWILSSISQSDVKMFMYPYPTGFITLFSIALVIYAVYRIVHFFSKLDAEKLIAMSLHAVHTVRHGSCCMLMTDF